MPDVVTRIDVSYVSAAEGWRVHVQGEEHGVVLGTKAEALEWAEDVSVLKPGLLPAVMVVHRRDGTVEREISLPRTRRGRLEVRPNPDQGWLVRGGVLPGPVHSKNLAVKRARVMARVDAPSILVIYRADGTVQREERFPRAVPSS